VLGYSRSSNTLTFNFIDLDHFEQFSGDDDYLNPKGDHLIEIKIYDSWGKFRRYAMMVRIMEPAPIVPVVVEEKPYIPPEIVKMTILDISIFGEMVVGFNTTMDCSQNSSEALARINSSYIDIYVNPFAKWNEDAGINISNWNLTWSVTKFNETTATFKLVFDSPNFISKMEVHDVLYMKIILPWTFLSQMGAPIALGPGPVSIGIQLADNNLNRGMNSSTEGSKTIMMVTLIVSLLLNVFMSGIMHHMLSMINSL